MIAKNCGGAVPDWRERGAGRRATSRCSREADALIGAARAAHEASRCISISPPCSRSSPRPTAISPAPSPGSWPRPIRRACALVLYVTIETLAHRRDPAAAGDAGGDGQAARSARRRRRRPAISRRLEASRGRRRRGRFGRARGVASSRARRCRRPRRSSRATSSRRAASASHDADRQPLPSRFSRLRRRARRGRRARARGRRRADDHHLDARRRRRAARRDRRALSTASISPSARIRTRRPRRRRRTRPRSARSPRIPNASASARPASTITTTTRRATSPSASFAPISRSRASSVCRSSSTRATPTTTSAAILRDEMGQGRVQRRSCIASPPRARSPRPGSSSASTISFSGVLTFKNSADLRAIARDVPLDRLLVETDAPFLAPRSPSRQAQRAGLRRRDRARARRGQGRRRRGARRGDARQHAARCFAKMRAGWTARLEPCADHPRLRLVRRRAARRAGLGRLRSRPIRATAAGAARCWSSATAPAARRPSSSTPRPTCASN